MNFARRLLAELNSRQSARSIWAVDAHAWLLRAVELVDDGPVHLSALTGTVRISMDAPGRRARLIKIYDGKLLLAMVERGPAPTGIEQHSLFTTTRRVRLEWRCRVAGEKRLFAELLLRSICIHAGILRRYGVPQIFYTSDPQQPDNTAQCLEWPDKQALVMTRVERAYATRRKIVHTSPTACHWADDIAPTVLVSFEA